MSVMVLLHAFRNTITMFNMQSPPPDDVCKDINQNHKQGHDTTPGEASPCLGSLPAVVPAAMVAATGDWRLLTLDINLNRIPSRAMAKRMRGRGNMEPNRLGRRGFMVKLRAFWERKHDTYTTVKEQHVYGWKTHKMDHLKQKV